VLQRRGLVVDAGGADESAGCRRQAQPEGAGLDHKVTQRSGGC